MIAPLLSCVPVDTVPVIFIICMFFFSFLDIIMAPRKGKKEVKEEVQVQLGPQVREGELVFGVAHIFASPWLQLLQ